MIYITLKILPTKNVLGFFGVKKTVSGCDQWNSRNKSWSVGNKGCLVANNFLTKSQRFFNGRSGVDFWGATKFNRKINLTFGCLKLYLHIW